jgi:hypothetical protein
MRLRSNVAGARFSIDGVEAPDAVVRGTKGETRKVRVEADGYAAVMAEVTLDPAMESMVIPLAELSPDVAPSAGTAAAPVVAPATAVTAPYVAAKPAVDKSDKSGGSKKTKPAATITAPTPTPTPKSTGGVAGGLTIKSD